MVHMNISILNRVCNSILLINGRFIVSQVTESYVKNANDKHCYYWSMELFRNTIHYAIQENTNLMTFL